MNEQTNQSFLKSIIKTPWATRNYILAIILFYSLDYFYLKWSYVHLSSNFFITILNYEVWRFLINFLYEPNPIVMALMLLHLICYLAKFVNFNLSKERQNGTVIAFFQIITIALLTQFFTLSYEALIYVLNDNNITEEWKVMFNIGAGGVFINIYLKFLWFNFKESNRFCSPRALFSYFYPIFLITAATVASEEIRVDMIAGYILSLIECCFFRGGMIFFTPETYTEKQQAVKYLRLNRVPLCNFVPLNQEKIKINRLGVVQANQFYILKSYIPAKSSHELNESQMQTQRGSFHRSNRMVDDELNNEGKGQKWEQTEIIDED